MEVSVQVAITLATFIGGLIGALVTFGVKQGRKAKAQEDVERALFGKDGEGGLCAKFGELAGDFGKLQAKLEDGLLDEVKATTKEIGKLGKTTTGLSVEISGLTQTIDRLPCMGMPRTATARKRRSGLACMADSEKKED
jgi:hypothetical protein